MAENPKEPYGADAHYADPGFQSDKKKRYPLDTKEHTTAAARYFGKSKNRDKYTAEQQRHIDNEIRLAEKRFGVGSGGEKSASVDSAYLSKAANTQRNKEMSQGKNFMARKQSFNPIRQHSELTAADAVINPLLEAAKITTIKVDGKDVPASDAPLADRIAALNALSQTGSTSADMSDLIAANDAAAKSNEKLTGDLAIANSSVAKLQGDVAKLTADLATSQASVNTLTASNAELQNRHDSTVNQVAALTKSGNETSREISALCVKWDVLDLKLPKSATESEKIEAANVLPVSQRLTALGGAVNSAFNKLGLPVGDLPAAGGGTAGADKKELKGRERMKAAMKIEGQ